MSSATAASAAIFPGICRRHRTAPQDFRDLLTALVASEARFLVVGAHALALLGVRERDFATPERASARPKDLLDVKALEG